MGRYFYLFYVVSFSFAGYISATRNAGWLGCAACVGSNSVNYSGWTYDHPEGLCLSVKAKKGKGKSGKSPDLHHVRLNIVALNRYILSAALIVYVR